MIWRLVPVGLALAVLSACTTTDTPREAPSNHPANPEAAEAPPPARSTTLAVASPATGPEQPAERPEHPHDHSAHHGHTGPASAPAMSGQPTYVCPMHADVVSSKADERCPKCKMKLKAKPGTTAVAATHPTPATRPAAPTSAGHDHQHGGH